MKISKKQLIFAGIVYIASVSGAYIIGKKQEPPADGKYRIHMPVLGDEPIPAHVDISLNTSMDEVLTRKYMVLKNDAY